MVQSPVLISTLKEPGIRQQVLGLLSGSWTMAFSLVMGSSLGLRIWIQMRQDHMRILMMAREVQLLVRVLTIPMGPR